MVDSSDSESNEDPSSNEEFEESEESEETEDDYSIMDDDDLSDGENNNDLASYSDEEENEDKCPAMDTLQCLLCSVKHYPVKFAIHGIIDKIHLPCLNIKNIGPIHLPLCESQAQMIISGDLTDSSKMLNYKEFPKDEYTFENPKFDLTIQSIFEKVKEKFGFEIDFFLHELVISGKGNQFSRNFNDVEENQFGTLIVQLPSLFTGNNVTIHHGKETETINFDRKESQSEIIYTAFHSNCKYKMTPLKSGYRLVLFYKLTSIDSTERFKLLEESSKVKQEIAGTLSELNKSRRKHFGIMLENKYPTSPYKCDNDYSLKGRDLCVKNMLQSANEILPKEEQYVFHVTNFNGGSEKKIGLFNGSALLSPKKLWDSTGLSLNMQNDILSSSLQNHERLRDRDYGCSRYFILAIPSNRHFECLCHSKSPTQCLQFLSDEVDHTSPQFKLYLKNLLNTYPSEMFTKNTGKALLDLVVKAKDVEIVLLYFDKIIAHCYNFSETIYGLPENAESQIAEMLKFVPWEEIKDVVENVIETFGFNQYYNWMTVFFQCEIFDIAHKVIELTLKIDLSVSSTQANYRSLWNWIFNSVIIYKELSTCWLDDITECVIISSDLQLLHLLCDKLLSNKPAKLAAAFNRFINCIKAEKLSSSNASTISSFVKLTLHDPAIFKEQLETLFDHLWLYDKDQRIIQDVFLHLMKMEDRDYIQTEGFKMIFNRYFDRLLENAAKIDRLGCFAELVFMANTSNMECYIKKYLEKCRTVSTPVSLFMVIKSIFRFTEKEKHPKYIGMIDDLVKIIIPLIKGNEKKNGEGEKYMLCNLTVSLCCHGDTFTCQVDEIFSNQYFKSLFERFTLQLIEDLEEIQLPKTESKNLNKLLRLILSGVQKSLQHLREGKKPVLNYKSVLAFTKILFSENHFGDIALEFLSFRELQFSTVGLMTKEKGSNIVQRMICDLEKRFSGKDSYGELMLTRVRNLLFLKDEGYSEFAWRIPNARFPNRDVEDFLRSNEVVFTYQLQQQDISTVKRYLHVTSGSRDDFNGIVRPSGEGCVEMILQKDFNVYEKAKKRYFDFMIELNNLKLKLKSYPRVFRKL
ncbi:uncharacterized protein [Clytia hemisphaerica]